MIKQSFYCYGCREYTDQKIERTKENFEIFVCQECGYRNSDYNYNCPECGSEPVEDLNYCDLEECQDALRGCGECQHLKTEKGSLIKMSEPDYNISAAIMYGGSPHDWIETHRCWNCGTIYEFSNSNY